MHHRLAELALAVVGTGDQGIVAILGCDQGIGQAEGREAVGIRAGLAEYEGTINPQVEAHDAGRIVGAGKEDERIALRHLRSGRGFMDRHRRAGRGRGRREQRNVPVEIEVVCCRCDDGQRKQCQPADQRTCQQAAARI
ncbi:MAG: hypothetical protein MUO77_11440 [Anaerolineales bacterium]|nr:hypothetical protein [Anaerolineales bacterium]